MHLEDLPMSLQSVPEKYRHPGPAPFEYAGQWVAWNNEQTKIVAHGPDLAGVHAAANAAGCSDAILEKVRKPGLFIGAT